MLSENSSGFPSCASFRDDTHGWPLFICHFCSDSLIEEALHKNTDYSCVVVRCKGQGQSPSLSSRVQISGAAQCTVMGVAIMGCNPEGAGHSANSPGLPGPAESYGQHAGGGERALWVGQRGLGVQVHVPHLQPGVHDACWSLRPQSRRVGWGHLFSSFPC